MKMIMQKHPPMDYKVVLLRMFSPEERKNLSEDDLLNAAAIELFCVSHIYDWEYHESIRNEMLRRRIDKATTKLFNGKPDCGVAV